MVLIWALWVACLPHPAVVRAAQPAEVAVAIVAPGADALTSGIAAALTARGLTPHDVGAPGAERTTSQRLGWLAVQSGGAAHVLLVEAQPTFYAQLGGRYRWTVDVSVTVGPVGGGGPTTDTFSVPVFLQFDHEREKEALAAAAPVVVRRVERLLDAYLGGLGGTTVASP